MILKGEGSTAKAREREALQTFVIVTVLAIFVMSVIAHEVAHGWVAYLCGDPTAKTMGRLTFNPIAHIDPIRTILLPIVLFFTVHIIFGGAKPVPVNPLNFRNPKRDNILVSLAGVTTNFLIAIGLALILRVLMLTGVFTTASIGVLALEYGVIINLLLAFFNLLPVPPLDGSHVLAAVLPPRAAAAYQSLRETGFVILMILIMFTPLFRVLLIVIAYSSRALVGHLPAFFLG